MNNGTGDIRESLSGPFSRRPGRWHPAALALGCGLSAALLASYFLEPTRSLWLALDQRVFWTLNRSLAWCRAWQVFWAIANSRASDIVAGLLMVGLYAHFMLRRARRATTELIAIGLMLTGLILVAVQIGKAIPYERPSATEVDGGALRLSELVAWIPTKDSSADTFPGDHAMVLFICAGVITFYLPRAYAIAAWVLAAVFMVPRVVSGGHWLTDDVVGSAAIAGAVLSCTFATPLHRITTDVLERVVRRARGCRGGSGGSRTTCDTPHTSRSTK